MWISTNFGFFSATIRTDKIPEGDNRTLQIRARRTSHLDNLRTIMLDQLGPTIEIENRDYQARAYTTPEAWGRALTAMSMGIDYTNFKNSVLDNELHDAYMKVWSAMADVYGTGYDNTWTNYRTTSVSKYISSSTGYTATPGKQGSHRGSDGKFAKKEITSEDLLHDEMEVHDRAANLYQSPLSLAGAAHKVGVTTRSLRDYMLSKAEWKKYHDGSAWRIPVDEIEDLEFKFWAEVGK